MLFYVGTYPFDSTAPWVSVRVCVRGVGYSVTAVALFSFVLFVDFAREVRKPASNSYYQVFCFGMRIGEIAGVVGLAWKCIQILERMTEITRTTGIAARSHRCNLSPIVTAYALFSRFDAATGL